MRVTASLRARRWEALRWLPVRRRTCAPSRSDKSAETFEAEFAQAYAELKADCDLIVTICDIHGGTPFNVISRSMLKGMDMVAFTGLSLPVLIELLLSRDQASSEDEIRQLIEAAHAQTLAEIKVEMTSDSGDEDDLDL